MVFPDGSVDKESSYMRELQETQVRSLGQEDPLLEYVIATHSSILEWATVQGVAKSRT